MFQTSGKRTKISCLIWIIFALALALTTAMKYLFFFLFQCCSLALTAQMPEVYQLTSTGSNCPVSLSLYGDGSFLYKEACESSPRVSFGKWTGKKDVIRFEPVNPQTYNVIANIETSHVSGDSIWLTILDKNGANLSQIVSAGLELSGRGSYLFSNDSSGTKKFVYRRAGGKIVLRTLNKLFGQRLEVNTDTANGFIITLNLLSEWLTSTHAEWALRTGFPLQKKGDKLLGLQNSTSRQVFQKKE